MFPMDDVAFFSFPAASAESIAESPLMIAGALNHRPLSTINEIGGVLTRLQAKSILLVADASAYPLSGAQALLAPLLIDYQVAIFDEFEPNPKLSDVQAGSEKFRQVCPDVVIAVGGGTAIDIAKLIAAFSGEEIVPTDIIRKRHRFSPRPVPLIAVPTTSGTGSEATQFAVLYIDGNKYSIDDPTLLPRWCVLDPNLTANLPARITAQTGLDAFCQAIESMWSVRSNEQSLRDAREAASLAIQHLHAAVHHPTPEARLAMCRASHLAGRAINQSRTTASHAISYPMTSGFGIPHGHAVAVTLGPMLSFNAVVTDSDINDPRGVNHVQRTIDEIVALLGCSTVAAAALKIEQFVESLGCATRLSRLGIQGAESLKGIVDQVNVERLNNNPRRMTRLQLTQLLESIA